MSLWLIGTAIMVYFYLVFQVALWVERRPSRPLSASVYVLSLAVYCTSWTYYGSIGTAAASGISFFPVYIGPIVVLVFCQPFLRKLLRVSQAQHITSISDFLAARYGKSPGLAVLVALIALLSVVPYIALQLQSVADTLSVISYYPDKPLKGQAIAFWSDPTFWIATLLSFFVIIFGTRRADASEQHRGMISAVALESLVKLLVFLACGVVVVHGLGGWEHIRAWAASVPVTAGLLSTQPLATPDFWLIALLSGFVIFCLPRQFQVMVVENTNPDHLRASRWMFPLYLIAINLFVLPLALAGLLSLPGGFYKPDTFMLALPLEQGHTGLALAVFIGGLSSATAMIIVETIALATMVSNDLVMPWLIGRHLMHQGAPRAVAKWVKPLRRATICGLLLLSYGFVRLVGKENSLASIGLMSFVAVAQFMPALVGGLYWQRGHWRGAAWGLVCGFLVWAYTLLLPILGHAGLDLEFLRSDWPLLQPETLFGITRLSLVTHSMVASLGVNILVYVGLSHLSKSRSIDRQQAGIFVLEQRVDQDEVVRSDFTNAQLLAELAHFIEPERLQKARQRLETLRGAVLDDHAAPDSGIQIWAETQLAGTLGASMARVVLVATLQNEALYDKVTPDMLSEVSNAIQTSWEAMRTTLDNVEQGVCMFDAKHQLLIWNRRVIELLDLVPERACVGTPITAFLPVSIVPVPTLPDGSGSAQVVRGKTVAWQWRSLPNGGLVGTFTDVTAQKEAKMVLEHKVAERTSEVLQQKMALEIEHGKVQRAHRDISLLSEIGREITTSLDRDTIMLSVYRHVHQLMDVDSFGIGILNEVQGVIDFSFNMAQGQRQSRYSCHLSDINQFPVWCVQQRKEVFINDLELDAGKYLENAAVVNGAHGLAGGTVNEGGNVSGNVSGGAVASPGHNAAGSLIYVPLLLKGKVLGLVSVCCRKKHGYHPVHLDMMITLAAYTAVALDNADAYQQLQSLQEKLLAQEKMAALGYLVGGIAHELNTPIGNSLLMASSLHEMSEGFLVQMEGGKMRMADLNTFGSDACEASSMIMHNLRRVAELVNGFKELAVNQQNAQRLHFNLQHISLDIVAKMMDSLHRQGHAITLDISEAIELDSYPAAYGEVLIHLINNALLHAFLGRTGGEMHLLACNKVSGWVQIRFSDNGSGIGEEDLGRIFDPFFTTRLGSGRNGLGLNIVYNLVCSLMGGQISVKSTLGTGTMFTIDLPLTARF